MTPGCQHVALVLSTYTNADGSKAHPSNALLVERTGTSKSTVSRSLKYLREHGWVTQESRGTGGSGKASVYRLTIPS
ncbi:helix-turn-helix domain-containing protein [Nocardioides bruguierae]|uniref:helix-turn-helix domain-containing protein n=1 Tax=Nocardioides bruguierae TaxID=2945102 RepID=UPI003555D042